MPSLRTIFLVAAATLTSFTAGVPIGANPLPELAPRKDLIDATAPIPIITDAGGTVINAIAGGAFEDVDTLVETVGGVVGLKREDKKQPDSLPVVLLALKAKVEALSAKLDALVGGKADIDAKILKPILEELHEIILAVIVKVKALIGCTIEVILTLDGKVLEVIDIAHFLCAILTVVCHILAVVVKVVSAVGLKVITALVFDIAKIVAELLAVIFKLLPTLLKVLVPLLDDVIKVLVQLKLNAVLDVLKVAHK